MAVAVAVAVSGGGGGAVAVPVAGLTKRFLNRIQKDFLINVCGYIFADLFFDTLTWFWNSYLKAFLIKGFLHISIEVILGFRCTSIGVRLT